MDGSTLGSTLGRGSCARSRDGSAMEDPSGLIGHNRADSGVCSFSRHCILLKFLKHGNLRVDVAGNRGVLVQPICLDLFSDNGVHVCNGIILDA